MFERIILFNMHSYRNYSAFSNHNWCKLASKLVVKRPVCATRCLGSASSRGKNFFPATVATIAPTTEIDQTASPLKFGSSVNPTTSELPNRKKIVIVGAGAQGMAIAYKLALEGYGPDTVILDQGQMGGGSTWHSAGIVSLLRCFSTYSNVEMRLSKMSKQLFVDLEDKGYFTGWKQVGSVHVAQSKERLHYLKRLKSESIHQQVETEIVTDKEKLHELCPLIRVDDLEGGLWVPEDGVANPYEICRALAALSNEMGVQMVDRCTVENILTKDGAVSGVVTNKGYVQCENFVNAAGMWARHVGHFSAPRVEIPMYPAEHYYLHTKPVSHIIPTTPVVHDPDAHIYFREDEGRFLVGGFEPVAKDFSLEDLPNISSSRDLPVDWDHFHILLEGLLHRVPALGSAILERLTNGPEPFSPDGNWILGQAPEIQNYFVATAMRSIGVGAAGGVAEVIVSHIIKRKPPFDMHNLDIQRFLPAHNNRKFLRDRVREVPGLYYSIPYPFKDFQTGRALRTSPIFPKLREAGARFTQVMGYERAMYFETEKDPVDVSMFGMTGGSIKGLDQPKEDQDLEESNGKY